MDKGEALEKMSNGYYIVTAVKAGDELKTRESDYIAAGTINWATQLSFEPLQIGISVQVDSHLNETIDYSGQFTLHILSEKQKELIEQFSRDSQISDTQINGIAYHIEEGQLILEDTIGYLACELKESVRCGDHTLQIGEVVNGKIMDDVEPLSTNELTSIYQGEGMG